MRAANILAVLGLAAMSGVADGQSVGRIVSQPARDVGLSKDEVPPLLVAATADPYGGAGTRTCAQIAAGIAALTTVIGPDFSASPARNRRNYAAIGGRTVVNSLIPFRGLVREVSGASAAERRKAAAIDAGIARRGFLRGMQRARGCRR